MLNVWKWELRKVIREVRLPSECEHRVESGFG